MVKATTYRIKEINKKKILSGARFTGKKTIV